MGRGLGHIQKELLKYFAELPNGGGTISQSWGNCEKLVFDEFKKKHWPEVYPVYKLMGQGKHLKEKNKIRVTIHNALNALIKRGLIVRIDWYIFQRRGLVDHTSFNDIKRAAERATAQLAGYGGKNFPLPEVEAPPDADVQKYSINTFWEREDIYITDAGRELIINASFSNRINK